MGSGGREVVLRQRLCRYGGCGRLFYICRSCDRGHAYCSVSCRRKGQRRWRSEVNRRYQQSREARRDHADRQREYRRRRAEQFVTDPGSPGSVEVSTLDEPVGAPDVPGGGVARHPFDTDELIPVRSRQTIYVSFDGNQYSIPRAGVGRPLTLIASDRLVRILDGEKELVHHRRSYERRRRIEVEAHILELLAEKRRARGSVASQRLLTAAPESEAFLEAAFARGESAAAQTGRLLELLDRYGAQELCAAITEALKSKTERASSVAYLLECR